MGIVDEDVVKVREVADIVAVITQHTQLRKVGQRWTGLCPFHTEKSPSFSVNGVEGLYYCFGCRASGDVITFVREIEHLDFVGAVEWLANKFGVTLRYTDHDEGASRKRHRLLQDTLARAVEWYHDRLLAGPDAGPARSYLRSRGFDRALVDEHRIGWAPDGWDLMARALHVPDDVLIDTGLGFRNKANRQQDFFRARILFPIFDDQGRPVAFGGRKLPDAEGPKYQNSRENPLYNKSRTLYGLHLAKADMVNSGQAVVCEGYTDVIGFFRAGVPRAVATCGTALTEEHIRSLQRFTKKLVLAYDADEAGQAASERVYEWEQRYEIEVAVLGLPKGSDPDEMSRSDPDGLKAAVAAAKPFLQFRLDRVLDAADLASPEGRARAAERAVDVIAEHPSPLVRDQYVLQAAATCRMEPDLLRELLGRPRPKRPTEGESRRSGTVSDGRGDVDDDPFFAGLSTRPVAPLGETAEREALRLFVGRRSEIEPWLCAGLFADERTRDAYSALADADVHAVLDEAPAAVVDLVSRLAVEESNADVIDVVVLLASEATRRTMRELERQAAHSDDPLAFSASMAWLSNMNQAIVADEPDLIDLRELIDWIDQHAPS